MRKFQSNTSTCAASIERKTTAWCCNVYKCSLHVVALNAMCNLRVYLYLCMFTLIYLLQVIEGKRLDVHIILDDPAGNSYIQVSVSR